MQCIIFNYCSRFYSSKGDESNASEGKHMPVKDSTHTDKGKPRREKTGMSLNHCDDHVRLGEYDQLEWLNSEKLSLESKRKESPFLTRRQRFKNELLRRLIPCEKINVSWDTFPYYMHEHTRNTLVECVSSLLKHKKFTASYGGTLASSSGRIMLQSFPGMELFLERLVRALAGKLQVPLLVLAPHGFGEGLASENEIDAESGEECTSDSEIEGKMMLAMKKNGEVEMKLDQMVLTKMIWMQRHLLKCLKSLCLTTPLKTLQRGQSKVCGFCCDNCSRK